MIPIGTVAGAIVFVLSMFTAGPVRATTSGFDSSYVGQSSFLDLQPGAVGTFQVFFLNTGTTLWGIGSATQVDLAACLEDKVTCDAQDTSEATWNDGWLSPTRYATTTQVITAPGSIATFTYQVRAPVGTPPSHHRFNGELVVHGSGERIHPEGYYQDATVLPAAATIYSLTPSSGDERGGTPIAAAGIGIVCSPAPTVSFGSTRGFISDCSSTTLQVFSPARPMSGSAAVMVTVTNAGSTPSNGVAYTYTDVLAPILIDARLASASGGLFGDIGDAFTITFSETMAPTTGTIDPTATNGKSSTVMHCGVNVSCTWNAGFTRLAVTVTAGLTRMPIPFSISLDGFTDLAGSAVDISSSFDRLVDPES